MMRRIGEMARLVRSERAVSVLWALVGLAGPTFLQLVYIVVAARVLGAEMTGNFFLVVSVATIASSFVGLGGGGLVMRYAARESASAAAAFGRAQAMSFVTFPMLLPLVVAGAWFVTKGQIPVWVILLLGASDLLAARMLTTSWSLFIALEEQVRASLLICTMPLARLAAIAITALGPEDQRLMIFSILYVVASFAVLVGALLYVRSRIGPARLTLRGFDRRSGASFSMTWLNAALQTESDKLLIGLFGGPAAMAVYGVASRLMDGAAMPPRALRVAFQSRLYREGAVGHASTFRLTVQLLPLAVIYGVAVWMGFWLMAPFIAWVFGDGFEQLTAILPILGALPLLRSVSDYGAEIFVASDRPGVQAWTQTFATAIRIVLGIVLIGAFGLIGAVSAALLMSFVSGLFLWALAIRLNRNAVRTRGSAP